MESFVYSKSKINMEDLNRNEILIKILNKFDVKNSQIDHLEKIKNKLWKCFLGNDGSMTQMLKTLFTEDQNGGNNSANGLQLILLSENIFDTLELINSTNDKENSSEILLNILKNLAEENLEGPRILQRKINFVSCQNKIIMIGLSFWDLVQYDKIYTDKNDQNKPIGLMMREKEIEYYKTIKNFSIKINNDCEDNYFIFRISVYKIQKKVAFILLEIFDPANLEKFFGKFE